MKTHVLCGSLAAVALSCVMTVEGGPAEDVKSAAEKLAAQDNYSWKTTVQVADDSRWRPGPTEGKTQKDGLTHLSMSWGENTMEVIMKGDKGALKMAEGWQSFAEASEDMSSQQTPGRFLVRRMKTFKAPASEAQDLLAKAKVLAKAGDAYTADLTEEGVKELLSFGRRRAEGEGPAISGAKGSVKFWIKNGLLAKYEYTVQGSVSFNNNDMNVDRTTTVEVKDVGTTKVEVPAGAKEKLS